jgi:cyclophilin family peptidyl-prolyl cis-trans isomerase
VTERGSITVELLPVDAPLTVDNFLSLTSAGFYRATRFHRVVPNFVAQDGDPRGDGNGGPGYSIRDELNRIRYDRGVVGMALSGPDTGGSQYFITHSAQPHLDGDYTAFGRVVAGFSVLDSLVEGDRLIEARIK